MLHEGSESPETRGALRLALGIGAAYAAFGIAWILLSDAAVSAVSTEPGWLEVAQRYKGLFYVLITAVGLAVLVRSGHLRLMRADRQARSSELRVQDLFMRHPQPMWLLDSRGLAFLKVNDAAILHYGYSADEFGRMTLADIRAPEDLAHRHEPAGSSLQGSPDVGVVRHRKKSGEVIYAQVSVHPVPFDGGTSVMAMAIDITRDMLLKQAMENQEQQFRQLHQSLGEVLWLASADGGNVLYVSPAIERIYGVSSDEFLRRPGLWLACVHPDDRALATASGARLKTEGRSSAEYRIVRPDGSVRWISDRKNVIVDEQGHTRMIGGIAEDITAIKDTEETLRHQAEELARRNAELERFNQATVGREIDMIELKREINRLLQQAGQPPRHTLAFLDPPGPPQP